MEKKRWLISTPFLVLLLVVGSFVTSTAYLQDYTQRLSGAAMGVVATTLPALEPLMEMRLEIHRIVTFGQSEGAGISPAARLTLVLNAQHRFTEAFHRYSQLPRQQGDEPLGAEMIPAADQLNSTVELAASEAQSNPQGAPSASSLDLLRNASEVMTGLLMQEMVLSARNSNGARVTLEQVRARSEHLARLLYGVCAIVAVVGSLLAAQAVRRYMQLSAKYAELQASRATELEQFSARVAHDILGPLQPISLGLGLLKSRLPPEDTKAQEVLGRLHRSLGRVRLIVDGCCGLLVRGRTRSRASTWACHRCSRA